MDATSAVGSDMVPVAVAVQPPFSVAVTVYVPAVKPVIVAVDAPLFQTYVVGFVPPVANGVNINTIYTHKPFGIYKYFLIFLSVVINVYYNI